jgi:hypothetical protein
LSLLIICSFQSTFLIPKRGEIHIVASDAGQKKD